ncbi:MAG: sigma-70 family RNA polymerase sigma factor [Solirubrobacteraceae bacterium]|nr:MAG: RNA polymerase subunit sigma-70 [Solirubrobacterales bacterium]
MAVLHHRSSPLELTDSGRGRGADPDTTDALSLLLAEAGRYKLLDATQEVELARRVERGDERAKALMITSNVRLVVAIARRYANAELDLADLVQEGALGLIRAVEKFDWRRGYRFSTYATWWIREAIERGIATKARSIRLPVNVLQRHRRIARAESELERRLGRTAGEQELAAAAGVSVERVREMRDPARTVTSLDRPVGDGSAASLAELLPASGPGPEEEVATLQRGATLRRALRHLPAREREVLVLRYGIGGRPPQALKEIGDRLGVTPQRVRQLEAQALGRLADFNELAGFNAAA